VAVAYIAGLVKVKTSELAQYEWSGRTIKYHRAQIRKRPDSASRPARTRSGWRAGWPRRCARASLARSASARAPLGASNDAPAVPSNHPNRTDHVAPPETAPRRSPICSHRTIATHGPCDAPCGRRLLRHSGSRPAWPPQATPRSWKQPRPPPRGAAGSRATQPRCAANAPVAGRPSRTQPAARHRRRARPLYRHRSRRRGRRVSHGGVSREK
jgi:hypothetical protein